MATFIGNLNAVNYTFLSTEVAANAVPGISIIGTICLELDTGYFWIVENDMTLSRYHLPSAATSVEPTAQASVDAYALVAGSVLDTLNNLTASFTIENTGANTISWKVIAGNESTLAAAIEAQAEATVTALAYGTFNINPAIWRYYGVYIKSTVPATPGEGTVIGVTKG